MRNYIQWIRERVGHELIFLNFAAAYIENQQGQILLQKRSPTEELWGFPGGALEFGESAEQAVIREVQEETGLVVSVESSIGVYTKYFSDYPNGDRAQTVLCFFRCNIIGGALHIDCKETFDLQFFTPDNVLKLCAPQHEDILRDGLNRRSGVFR